MYSIMNNIQKGFTLIELMVVVVILGILAAVTVPIYQGYVKTAQNKVCLQEGITVIKKYIIWENHGKKEVPDPRSEVATRNYTINVTRPSKYKLTFPEGSGSCARGTVTVDRTQGISQYEGPGDK